MGDGSTLHVFSVFYTLILCSSLGTCCQHSLGSDLARPIWSAAASHRPSPKWLSQADELKQGESCSHPTLEQDCPLLPPGSGFPPEYFVLLIIFLSSLSSFLVTAASMAEVSTAENIFKMCPLLFFIISKLLFFFFFKYIAFFSLLLILENST